MLEEQKIKQILEAAILASDAPLTVARMGQLFQPDELDEEAATKQIRAALAALQDDAAERGVELKKVASGYRYQVRQDLSSWVSRLWDEKPPRYTRALLETLALIAYKQPVTRGDIEQVRGVSVSQNIMRTLVEREWIKVVGQREVPGRPSLYATTKAFLDYFNLNTLNELPPLPEIRQLIEPVLAANEAESEQTDANPTEPKPAESTAQELNADAHEPSVDEREAQKSDEEIVVSAVVVTDDDLNPKVDERDESLAAEVVPLHPSGNSS